MKETLTDYVEYGILIGSIIGAVAAMKTSKEKLVSRILSFFIGVPVAVALSPLLCSVLSLTEDNLRMGVAVITGYGGITLLNKILLTAYKKLDTDGKP